MLTRSTLTNLTLIAFVASGGPRPGEIRHGAMKIYL